MGFAGQTWRKFNFLLDDLVLKLLSVGVCEWRLKEENRFQNAAIRAHTIIVSSDTTAV